MHLSKEPKSVIVHKAHDIWKRWGEQDFVAAFSGHQASGRKIWVDVGFLGRLRTAYNVLVRAMERLDGLGDVTIQALTLPRRWNRKRWDEANKAWTLSETFQSLVIPYTDATVKELCGDIWSRDKLTKRFDEIQGKAPQVHVEMQLLLFGAQLHLVEANPSSCIGCSKRSCFLCWKFLGMHGGFRTRATHGKIYHMWSIPHVKGVPGHLQALVVSTLVSVEESVLVDLSVKKNRLQLVKESTVWGSSVGTRVGFEGTFSTTQRVQDYLLIQRQSAQASTTIES